MSLWFVEKIHRDTHVYLPEVFASCEAPISLFLIAMFLSFFYLTAFYAYAPGKERIELSLTTLEIAVLPLNYSPVFLVLLLGCFGNPCSVVSQ